MALISTSPGRANGTLVVVFLRGGADALSLVPPVGDDSYHRARPTLRVTPGDAIPVDGYFGLHPELRPLHRHLLEGRLAVIHGAGSEDTTRSHFSAQDFMERGGDHGGGWLARYLRARRGELSPIAAVALGDVQPESLRGAPTVAVIRTIADFSLRGEDPALLRRLAALYGAEPGALGGAGRSTLAAIERLASMRAMPQEASRTPASDGPGAAPDSYPEGSFGRGLREVASLIRAEVGVEVATIDMLGGGLGWDTHFLQNQAFPALARELASGLDAFWRDLGRHAARTTVVVLTEFGRRLRENSSLGTDHGAGSTMFILGEGLPGEGPIRAGAVSAGWSDLADDQLVGPGDVPVVVDYRVVLASLLRRIDAGVNPAEVFPGLAM